MKATIVLIADNDAQKRLNEELYKVFGPCPAEHDNDYIFHMTFAIGGADYESYQWAYDELIKSDYNQIHQFITFGVFEP